MKLNMKTSHQAEKRFGCIRMIESWGKDKLKKGPVVPMSHGEVRRKESIKKL